MAGMARYLGKYAVIYFGGASRLMVEMMPFSKQ